MTKFASLIFIAGLAFFLMVVTGFLPIGHSPMLVGNAILDSAKEQVGAANVVTSVVLAYRGLDTLGELSILFAAASAVGLVLTKSSFNKSSKNPTNIDESDSGFVAINGIDLIFPLLLVVGMYIISHGHLTPGGGFQGGVVLAIAFAMRSIVRPRGKSIDHGVVTFIEAFAGLSFIVIGLVALSTQGHFLQPMLDQGHFGSLWSAGTIPLLYLAVGLKVGAELAGLILALNTDEVNI